MSDKTALNVWPFVAIGASFLVSTIVIDTSPQTIGALSESFTIAKPGIGLLTSVAIATNALFSGLAALVLRRFSLASLAVTGTATVAAGLAVAALGQSLVLTSGALLVSSAGAGLVGGVGASAIATQIDPDRAYALGLIGATVVGAACLALIGPLTTDRGPLVGFAAVAVLATMSIPLVRQMPSLHLRPTTRQAESTKNLPTTSKSTTALVTFIIAIAIRAALASAVWVQSGDLGKRANLSVEATGYALSVSYLLGLAGAALALGIPKRAHRTAPMTVATLLNTVASAALLTSLGPAVFVFVLIAWNVTFNFMLPLAFGLATDLDRTGRFAAILTAAATASAAVGPAVLARTVDSNGYSRAAEPVMAIGLASTLLILPALRIGDRHHRNGSLRNEIP